MGLVTDDLTAQMPVKEELDRAVPPHELLDVSASKAKAELATRGGLAGRQLPTSKKGSGGLSSSSSVSLAYSITYKEGIFFTNDRTLQVTCMYVDCYFPAIVRGGLLLPGKFSGIFLYVCVWMSLLLECLVLGVPA